MYAIFTARSEDKWYYITAVLINVALLLMLMIGAIIFDKIYLKKWNNSPRPAEQHTSTISNDPEVFDRTNVIYQENFPSIMTDVPPEYPGYYQSSICNNQQHQNSPNVSNIVLIAATHDFVFNLTKNKTKSDDIKLNLPPHYTELYPNTQINMIITDVVNNKEENNQ